MQVNSLIRSLNCPMVRAARGIVSSELYIVVLCFCVVAWAPDGKRGLRPFGRRAGGAIPPAGFGDKGGGSSAGYCLSIDNG